MVSFPGEGKGIVRCEKGALYLQVGLVRLLGVRQSPGLKPYTDYRSTTRVYQAVSTLKHFQS